MRGAHFIGTGLQDRPDLAKVGGLLSSMTKARNARKELNLCVLATSDVHAKILAFNYFREAPTEGASLARLATLVRDIRAKADATLLLDNGDFLQGEPIADVALSDVMQAGNPVVSAMNALAYDAIGLGNHEFDLDEPLLRASLAPAGCPILCANLTPGEGAEAYRGMWAPRVVLPVRFGGGQELRVGVLSVLPPKVCDWNALRIQGHLVARDMVEAAQEQAKALRQEGADIVIALAHSGIGAADYEPYAENASRHIAAISEVDAVIAGHVHERFPGYKQEAGDDVDGLRGSVHGKPVVMPSARAACLGKIDLSLSYDENARAGAQWQVRGFHCELMSPEGLPEAADIVVSVSPAKAAARKRLARVVGEVRRPVTSHFTMLQDDCATRLIAESKIDAVSEFLQNTPHEGLPLLASVAPARCGGRDGPESYVGIQAGPLLARDVSEIQPFANYICLLRVTGAELAEWLEMANSLYNQLLPDQPEQLLIERDMPPYKRETVYGVGYQVDLSQPARYDVAGKLVRPTARRICDLKWQGVPVTEDQVFLLASNDFRGGGGGNFPATACDRHVTLPPILVRDAIVRHLEKRPYDSGRDIPSWVFKGLEGISAVFETGSKSGTFAADVETPVEFLGEADGGFRRYLVNFGDPYWPL